MTPTSLGPPPPDPLRRSDVQHVMGMPMSVLLRGPGARTAESHGAVAALYDELRRLDGVFSTYRPDSEVSRLARGDLTADACSDEVRDVLALCERARDDTDGWFDHERPGPDGIRRLDPTGLVKGWAAERAARCLAALADVDWLLNAGGDVVLHSRGEPFRVGVQSPFDDLAVLDVVPLVHGGVATSGAYRRGGHVVDPQTGRPASGLAGASVVAPSLLQADVLATASFAEGPAAIGRLEQRPGVEGLLLLPDGRRLTTSGWPGTGA